VAYTPAWRFIAAALEIFGRGSLLAIVAVLWLTNAPPSNPLKMTRLFSGLFLAPEIAAWCVARAYSARVEVDQGIARIIARGETIEIPLASIAAVEPWRLPVPSGGITVRLGSGRRLPRAIRTADPVALLDAMVAAGADAGIRKGLDRPIVVYERARLAHPYGPLENWLVKFVVFSLVPAVPVFRLHQYITYGGTFGEYYTFGLGPYLAAFGIWWATWLINLALFASVLRAVVEILALAVAVAVPSWAVATRGFLEIAQRVVYYIGFPVWLLLRLTA